MIWADKELREVTSIHRGSNYIHQLNVVAGIISLFRWRRRMKVEVEVGGGGVDAHTQTHPHVHGRHTANNNNNIHKQHHQSTTGKTKKDL